MDMGLEISERTSAISTGLVVCCTGLNSKDIYSSKKDCPASLSTILKFSPGVSWLSVFSAAMK